MPARSKGSAPLTIGALADDASRLLTALRIPRAIVCGLSMGGMVALPGVAVGAEA